MTPGQEALFTDGPILESKEHLAGFWIIEAADLDVALKDELRCTVEPGVSLKELRGGGVGSGRRRS